MRASYDRIASEYTRRIADELAAKPFDRGILDRFAETLAGKGRICDLACGPGHVAHYLHERSADVFGLDFSPGMVREAQARYPAITFVEGDMTALPLDDASLAGIVAFYGICNIPESMLPKAFAEMQRVLEPGGRLLIAFHIGDGAESVSELWGHAVSLEFFRYSPPKITALLACAGFFIDETRERAPYPPEVEYQSHRAYILSHRRD